MWQTHCHRTFTFLSPCWEGDFWWWILFWCHGVVAWDAYACILSFLYSVGPAMTRSVGFIYFVATRVLEGAEGGGVVGCYFQRFSYICFTYRVTSSFSLSACSNFDCPHRYWFLSSQHWMPKSRKKHNLSLPDIGIKSPLCWVGPCIFHLYLFPSCTELVNE